MIIIVGETGSGKTTQIPQVRAGVGRSRAWRRALAAVVVAAPESSVRAAMPQPGRANVFNRLSGSCGSASLS